MFIVKIIISILLLLTPLSAIELDWLHDYDKALAEAKKENKGVYLFIGADKCKFCALFKENTLSDDALMQRLRKDYVLLYLSRDRHKIPSGLQTKGAPIHYFLDADGKIIYNTWGNRGLRGFHLLLDEAELSKEE